VCSAVCSLLWLVLQRHAEALGQRAKVDKAYIMLLMTSNS
jgi:hypothetical protein